LLFFLVLAGSAVSQPRYRVFDFRDPKLRAFTAHAQFGVASYFGDLCETGDCYSKSKFNLGFGMNYRMNDYIFFTLNGQYYRIGGADLEVVGPGTTAATLTSRERRNLSFRADNFELSFVGNFEFLNYNTFRYLTRREFPISVFFFTGLGMTTSNPKAEYRGEWVALRPLQTEGVSYSPVTAIVPLGLGVSYRVLNNLTFSFNAGYRFSFSDYLDDVSTNYPDPSKLGSQEARDLSNRSFRYYGPGSKRGNPAKKDGYLLLNFKAEYGLPKVPFLRIRSGKGVRRRGGSVAPPSRQIPSRRK
jgi:opacity protein-like surface antigen